SIGDKSYWNRGIGTEVTRMIVEHAFVDMNLNRVSLEVHAFNPRAIRAYEKAGFTREGVARQGKWANGAFHDIVQMSILRAECLAERDRDVRPARSVRKAPPP